jgi:hypothetical protein
MLDQTWQPGPHIPSPPRVHKGGVADLVGLGWDDMLLRCWMWLLHSQRGVKVSRLP